MTTHGAAPEADEPRMGRPYKGDRVPTYFRPHRRVRQALEVRSAELGYDSLSDYVAALAAREVAMDELAPPPARTPNHPRLPMTG